MFTYHQITFQEGGPTAIYEQEFQFSESELVMVIAVVVAKCWRDMNMFVGFKDLTHRGEVENA